MRPSSEPLPPERLRAAAHKKILSEKDTPDHLRDNVPQKGRRHSSPLILQMNPINPHKQKNKTESSNRLELAPTGAHRCHRNTARQRQKKTSQRRLDIPNHVNDHLGLKGRRHSFTPIIRMNPMSHQEPKKPNRVMEGSRTAHEVRAPACLPVGQRAGALERATPIVQDNHGRIGCPQTREMNRQCPPLSA